MDKSILKRMLIDTAPSKALPVKMPLPGTAIAFSSSYFGTRSTSFKEEFVHGFSNYFIIRAAV